MTKPKLLDLFCGAGGAAMGYHRAGFEVVGVDIKPQPRYPFELHQGDALTWPLDGFDAVHASPPCQGYSSAVTSASSRYSPTLGKDEPRLIPAVRRRFLGPSFNRIEYSRCDCCGEEWCGRHQRHYADCACPDYETQCLQCDERWDESDGQDFCPVCAWKPVRPRVWVIENVVGARYALSAAKILLCGSMFGLDIPRHRYFEPSFPMVAPRHPKCSGMALRAAERRGWDYRDMSVTGKGRHAGTSDRWRELLGIDWPTTQHELSEAIPPAYTEYVGRRMMAALGQEPKP